MSSNKLNFTLPPDKFIEQINTTFKQYRIPPIKVHKDCGIKEPSIFDKFFKTKKENGKLVLSNPQKFISSYFTPSNPNGLLIHHSVGAGKSITAINLFKQFEKLGFNTIFVTRTTLKKDIDKAIELIPLNGTLLRFSYKQFSNICRKKGDNYKKLLDKARKLNDKTNDPFYKTLIIIDEAHKLYTKDLKPQEMHDIGAIEKVIFESYKNSNGNRNRIVLMSATPITEDPMEIIQLFNLLITEPKERFDIENFYETHLDTTGQFSKNGINEFKSKVKGLISYLDLSRDPSKFAKVKYTQVLVPISQKPDYIPVTMKTCNDRLKECNKLDAAKESEYVKGICKLDFERCKKLIETNKKIIKNSKYQRDYLASKCGIVFEEI
jgi:hypothetical protein